MWSDESRLQLHTDLQRGVFEDLVRSTIVNESTTVKHGGRGVMVWGAFSAAGTGELLQKSKLILWNTGEYCRKARFPQLKCCFLKLNNQMLFFNKTPVHTAKTTKTWLENKSIRLMF